VTVIALVALVTYITPVLWERMMPRKRKDQDRPVVPTPEMVSFAQQMLHQLDEDRPRFALQDRETGQTFEINETVYELVRRLLIELAQNRPVSIIPHGHELTTYEAADFLNVSRGYILKLVNEGKLAHKMVGTHRRIRLEDLLTHRDEMNAASDNAMEELAEINEKLGLE
jgi:excisionase family DNA binding protein